MKTLLATMTVLVGLSGVAAAQPYPPMPPMYQEVVPRPWGPRYVWQPGHWQWNGYSYVWIRGRYVPVHQHRGHWVHGHWQQGPNGSVWVQPGWR